ncbi:unnamed protein product [Calypogeia fissa]
MSLVLYTLVWKGICVNSFNSDEIYDIPIPSDVEAYRLFLQMWKPNVASTADRLQTKCGHLHEHPECICQCGGLEWVEEVHGHASKSRLESDMRVANAGVHMYAKSGSKDDSQVLFDRMEKRDVVTWNVLIGGLANIGMCA